MFGGAYELSIDSKGRLAIPAKFRELLARHYSPFLVGTLEKRSHLLLYFEVMGIGSVLFSQRRL